MSKRLVGWLIFAGLLCGGLYYLSFFLQSRRPVALALETASQSQAVVSYLGSQYLKKTFVSGRIISGSDYGNADLVIHVAGSNAQGTLLEWAQNGFGGWHICSLVLLTEKSGREITVVSDEHTHCERE
jgi:Cytochrome oxidase complex assembly protein 1